MKYSISDKSTMGSSPVWWIMDGTERIAGVHWGLHDGESSKAKQVAQKIVDALDAASKPHPRYPAAPLNPFNKDRELVDELKAENHRLREALEENHYSNSSDKAINLYNQVKSATPTQSLQAHDDKVIAPHKKALEFAEYMAKCIEQFMVTVNELDIADENGDETLVDIMQERRGEYWRAVNTSVYEFRKRAMKVQP